MSSGSPQCAFLSLPLELRERVYQELLAPNPAKPAVLYHDRYGRGRSLSFHHAIICANKQIYAESLPILYEFNTFSIHLATSVVIQCTGGYYPDQIADPDPLVRSDVHPWREASCKRSWRNNYDQEEARYPFGVIYPECLRCLRHIELFTSPSAIWASAMGGEFFSFTGDLIIKVLEILAADATHGGRKTLEFCIEPGWLGQSLFASKGLPPRRGRRGKPRDAEKIKKIIRGLKDVNNVRVVEVIECGKQLDLADLEVP